jgi:hypothetical protein
MRSPARCRLPREDRTRLMAVPTSESGSKRSSETTPASRCALQVGVLPVPRRKKYLLIPIAYHRHYGRTVWIDPIILRAITISWNDIRVPVGCWSYDGPDDENPPWFLNDSCLRPGCGNKGFRATQRQGRSESERYGHYPHASTSLPTTDMRFRSSPVVHSDYNIKRMADPSPPQKVRPPQSATSVIWDQVCDVAFWPIPILQLRRNCVAPR